MVGKPHISHPTEQKSALVRLAEPDRRSVGKMGGSAPIYDWTAVDAAVRDRVLTVGTSQLAAELGITQSQVKCRAWKLGIRLRRRDSNPSVRHDYFDTWTANMAWLLGYTWADGCVYVWTSVRKGRSPLIRYQLRYSCREDDRPMLERIKQELAPGHAIGYTKEETLRTGYVAKAKVSLAFDSKGICESLQRIGVPPRKSTIDPAIPLVPPEFLAHFVRGVIDGDGSIHWKTTGRSAVVVINGSNRFIAELQPLIVAAVGVPMLKITLHPQSARVSTIKWAGAADVLRLITWLYPANASLALERKRSAARDIVSQGLVTIGGRRIHCQTPGGLVATNPAHNVEV